MARIGSISASLSLDARMFVAGIAKANTAIDKFDKALAGIGLATGAGLAASVREFATFEKGIARAAGAATRETSEFDGIFDGFTKAAKQASVTTEFTARQMADGLNFLAMAGNSASQSIKALPAVAQLASSSMISLGSAADITTNIMAGFGKSSEDLESVNDQLVGTFTSSNVSLTQLGESMKQIGSVARATGVEFDDVLAAVGQLGNAGRQGEEAGTGLARVLLNLSGPSKQQAEAFNKLGVSIRDVSEGGISQLIRNLESAQSRLGKIEFVDALSKGFGKIGIKSVAALVSQGADAFDELRMNIQAADEANKAAFLEQKQLETLQGQLNLLKSEFAALAIEIGNSLKPTIAGLASGVKALVAGFSALPAPIKETIVGVAAVTASVGTLTAALRLLGAAGITSAVAGAATTAIAMGQLAVEAGTAKGAIEVLGLVFPRLASAIGVATTAMRAALLALGPLGIAAFAAGGALLYFANKSRETSDASRLLGRSAGEAFEKLKIKDSTRDSLLNYAATSEDAAMKVAELAEQARYMNGDIDESSRKLELASQKAEEAAKEFEKLREQMDLFDEEFSYGFVTTEDLKLLKDARDTEDDIRKLREIIAKETPKTRERFDKGIGDVVIQKTSELIAAETELNKKLEDQREILSLIQKKREDINNGQTLATQSTEASLLPDAEQGSPKVLTDEEKRLAALRKRYKKLVEIANELGISTEKSVDRITGQTLGLEEQVSDLESKVLNRFDSIRDGFADTVESMLSDYNFLKRQTGEFQLESSFGDAGFDSGQNLGFAEETERGSLGDFRLEAGEAGSLMADKFLEAVDRDDGRFAGLDQAEAESDTRKKDLEKEDKDRKRLTEQQLRDQRIVAERMSAIFTDLGDTVFDVISIWEKGSKEIQDSIQRDWQLLSQQAFGTLADVGSELLGKALGESLGPALAGIGGPIASGLTSMAFTVGSIIAKSIAKARAEQEESRRARGDFDLLVERGETVGDANARVLGQRSRRDNEVLRDDLNSLGRRTRSTENISRDEAIENAQEFADQFDTVRERLAEVFDPEELDKILTSGNDAARLASDPGFAAAGGGFNSDELDQFYGDIGDNQADRLFYLAEAIRVLSEAGEEIPSDPLAALQAVADLGAEMAEEMGFNFQELVVAMGSVVEAVELTEQLYKGFERARGFFSDFGGAAFDSITDVLNSDASDISKRLNLSDQLGALLGDDATDEVVRDLVDTLVSEGISGLSREQLNLLNKAFSDPIDNIIEKFDGAEGELANRFRSGAGEGEGFRQGAIGFLEASGEFEGLDLDSLTNEQIFDLLLELQKLRDAAGEAGDSLSAISDSGQNIPSSFKLARRVFQALDAEGSSSSTGARSGRPNLGVIEQAESGLSVLRPQGTTTIYGSTGVEREIIDAGGTIVEAMLRAAQTITDFTQVPGDVAIAGGDGSSVINISTLNVETNDIKRLARDIKVESQRSSARINRNAFARRFFSVD